MSPVPEDVQLPCGWVCKRVDENELVLGREEGSLEVVATRADESRVLPSGLARGWELTCRSRAGESMSETVIGRVTTRAAATDALRSYMERVSTLVRTTGSTAGFSPVLLAREIDLRGEIPMPFDQPTGNGN